MPAPQDLSIRQLQYIVAVADTLGFHRAAQRCHVSQPALSAQVQQAEAILGAPLFERDRRRVLLTPAGEQLVARARRVLLELDDLLSAAARLADPLAGSFRVGVIPTVAPYLLPEVAAAVTAAHPSLQLIYREEKTAEVLRGLREGSLDLGLLALDVDLGECARAEVLTDPFVVALPPGHPLTRHSTLSLSDLDGETVLLLDDGHCLRSQALALCARARARESDFRATSLATLVQMVASGAGITLLPTLAVSVENRRAQLVIRPLKAPVPARTLGLAWRPQSPFGDAFRTLSRTLATAVSPTGAVRPPKPAPRKRSSPRPR